MNTNYILNIDDIPVKEAHKLNLNKLSAFLTGKIKNFSGITAIGQFNAGQSNPTYVIESMKVLGMWLEKNLQVNYYLLLMP